MPVPPPLPDPAHIGIRLEVVVAMLEQAVEEVRRAMADIGGKLPGGDTERQQHEGSKS